MNALMTLTHRKQARRKVKHRIRVNLKRNTVDNNRIKRTQNMRTTQELQAIQQQLLTEVKIQNLQNIT